MRWTREEYLELMTFGRPPRPMFVELFGPLVGLEAQWRAQGASDAEINLSAFDFDYVPRAWSGLYAGPMLPPTVTIEETEHLLVQRDGLGRTLRMDKRTATIPLPSDFPVRTMDDWLKVKPFFQWRDDRINHAAMERAAAAREQGELVLAGIPGAFDTLRELMGEESACLAYYDQPELVEDVLRTIGETAQRVLETATRRLRIDQLSVHEDFAGRSGPLVGPVQIEQWWKPYYRRCWDVARSLGARIFQIDTDGNVNAVIDALLDCGINSLYPMEPAAGMDIVACRARYGTRLAYLGGIDKHVLRQDRAAIRAELEYKLQLRDQPGIVFGLDHRIPDNTPLENYRYYVATAREILGLPPPRPGEWRRMAF
jgi:uroporphyrinogen-III decarboxylase